VVTDRPGRRVEILLAVEDVVVTESLFGPGEPGPGLHVHRFHADCFYVLEGELTLALPDREHVLGPGTFALVPPQVVHAFRQDGSDAVRFLNLHAPGMAFDRYLLELYAAREGAGDPPDWFDQHPPPTDGGRDPATVIVRTAETDAVTVAGTHVGFLASADETLDAIGLVAYTAPPGFSGPPLHLHERTWDAFYVLEGRLAVRLGDERRELGPGDHVAVPPGTVHGFASPGDAPARFLDIHAPAGFERYFREAAAAVGDGPVDPQVLARIASRYDVRPA